MKLKALPYKSKVKIKGKVGTIESMYKDRFVRVDFEPHGEQVYFDPNTWVGSDKNGRR